MIDLFFYSKHLFRTNGIIDVSLRNEEDWNWWYDSNNKFDGCGLYKKWVCFGKKGNIIFTVASKLSYTLKSTVSNENAFVLKG